MNESNFFLIGGFLAIVAALFVLAFAFYGFQQSLKETNRKRRRDLINDNPTIELPDIANRPSSSERIEFGEIIEVDFPDNNLISSIDSSLGRCAVCRKNFSGSNPIICPDCEAKYHDHCFSEYDRMCINCGWKPS